MIMNVGDIRLDDVLKCDYDQRIIKTEDDILFNFYEGQAILGQFYINKNDKGKLIFDFEGDTTECAKLFVCEVERIFNEEPN
jgi:hypothetical protein